MTQAGKTREPHATRSLSGGTLRIIIAWRAFLLLAISAHAGAIYIALRAMQGGIGFDFWRSLRAFALAALMMLLICVLFMIVELPEAILLHGIPRRRAARGRCPGCGYDMRRLAFPCPECGSDGGTPPRYLLSRRPVRVFVIMTLIALPLGSVLGEIRLAVDEAAFTRDADLIAATSNRAFTRRRAWPASFAWLRYDQTWGVSAPPPFSSPRIPGSVQERPDTMPDP